MELHPPSRLDSDAVRVCRRYLDRLPLAPDRKRALLDLAQREADVDRAMARLHHALAAGRGSETWRLGIDSGSAELAAPGLAGHGNGGAPVVAAVPPVHRTPMAPAGWPTPIWFRILGGRRTGFPGRWASTSRGEAVPAASDSRKLTRTATVRRTVFTLLALLQTAVFAYYMTTRVLPYHGESPWKLAILSLFTILFAWVSLGFWTALSGWRRASA